VSLLSASSPGDSKPTLDSSLVQRLRAGDTAAFAEVYDSHSRVVYGLILRMVRDSAIAEDLLQEIFLKLWRSASSLDSRATSIEPWLIAITRNHVLDYLKSRYNRTAMKSSPLDLNDLAGHLTLWQNDFIFVERAELLRVALDRLDDHQRQVLNLAYFEGLTQTEIAVRLNLPLGTVKSHVRIALRNLRKQLEKEQPEP
jgi:RNA polymerase sigma-70 factor (ECF subfamily)